LPASRRAALFLRAVLDAYLDIYHTPGEDGPDSGTVRYDPRSTVAGQAEAAVNRDHHTLEVIAQRRMGFSSTRRASDTSD
jgi:hypothetical protein